MCYSVRSSIISYLIAMISGIIAIYNGIYALGLFIIAYSQIQLHELIIWYSLDTNNEKLNKFGTSLGKYMLPMHNIGLSIGILLSVMYVEKRKVILKDLYPLIMSIVFYLIITIIVYPNTPMGDTTNSQYPGRCDKGRLNWPYPSTWYIFSYFLSIFILLQYNNSIKSKLAILLYTFILVLSFIVDKKHTPTLWCFSAAIISPIVVGISLYFK